MREEEKEEKISRRGDSAELIAKIGNIYMMEIGEENRGKVSEIVWC